MSLRNVHTIAKVRETRSRTPRVPLWIILTYISYIARNKKKEGKSQSDSVNTQKLIIALKRKLFSIVYTINSAVCESFV